MKYRTIVVDPPWPLAWTGGPQFRKNGRGEVHLNTQRETRSLPYRTMSRSDLEGLRVEDVAERDAALFLWAPDRFVLDGTAQNLVRTWQFTPLRFIVWAKTGFGLGHFPRPQHELLIVARRGDHRFTARNIGSVHVAGVKRYQHSAKPDLFHNLIERASPGPYLELFARRERPGWDIWGDEAPNAVELPL